MGRIRALFSPLFMRRMGVAGAAIGFAFVLAWGLSQLKKTDPPKHAKALEARLELAAGEVRVGYGKDFVSAVSGQALLAGARVETGPGARALARLSDGSAIFLRENSALNLEEKVLQLAHGEMWIDAPPSERQVLLYQAGAGTVSAENAGLDLRHDDTQTTLYVARGMASFSTKGGRVEVQAGEQALAQADQAPLVSPVAFWVDWTGGMGDHRMVSQLAGAGSGLMYGVDLGGVQRGHAQKLEINRQAVHTVIRDGLAETEVDQSFFNPGQNDVEGWYWFTVPESASVTAFALENRAGQIIAGELIERKEAVQHYAAAAQSGGAPALLEWVDGRSYRARVTPIKAGKTRRVILRYIQLLDVNQGQFSYLYPLQSDPPVRIGEFSLSVDLGDEGTQMNLTTLADARVEAGGRLVTMRRSGYTPRTDFLLEGRYNRSLDPVRVSRFTAGGDQADYILARYSPEIAWAKIPPQKAEIVLVVDSSADADDQARQLKTQSAEALLRALSDKDRFAVMALDVRATILHPQSGLATADEVNTTAALEALAGFDAGGATDLSAMFDVALQRLHGAEQPALIYIGDGLATSGALSGSQIAERLRRALSTSHARFFTVAVGSNANRALLAELANIGGGQAFRVDNAEDCTESSLRLAAAIKTPTLTEFGLDLGAGLDEVMVSVTGKVSQGDEVVVLARSHHALPDEVVISGRLNGNPFQATHRLRVDDSLLGQFVPRLWAAEKIRRMLGRSDNPDRERGRIVKLGMDYGLMTPFTSILGLDSEQAYRQRGIQRHSSPLRGQRLASLVDRAQKHRAVQLAELSLAATGLGCGNAAPNSEPSSVAGQRMMAKVAKSELEPNAPMPGEEMPMPAPQDLGRANRPAKASPSVSGRGRQVSASLQAQKEEVLAAAYGDDKDGASREKKRDQNQQLLRLRKTKAPRRLAAPRSDQLDPRQCSDIADRPLAQRRAMWQKRFRSARQPRDLLNRYNMAMSACELNDWASEAMFLRMLAERVDSPASAAELMQFFAGNQTSQRYLGQAILRRHSAADIRLIVERTFFGAGLDWEKVDRDLAALPNVIARIAYLREAMSATPNEVAGVVRMMRLLTQAGRVDEAELAATRLRDQGLMTPILSRQLGEVFAKSGLKEKAIRVFSEIIEFNADDASARSALGDIYLAHAWFQEAYAQYKTLLTLKPQDVLANLRLARAAAGAGRVDEALRIERNVADQQGRPGPDDPRKWARLASAARIAQLIVEPPAVGKKVADNKALTQVLERKLKQLQLFSGPSTLLVLTWGDLGAQVALRSSVENRDVAVGETVQADAIGLAATWLTTTERDSTTLVARLQSAPRDSDLALRLHEIRWDGKDFAVKVSSHVLPALGRDVGMTVQ